MKFNKYFGATLMIFSLAYLAYGLHYLFELNDDLIKMMNLADMPATFGDVWLSTAMGVIPYTLLISSSSVIMFVIGLSFFTGTFMVNIDKLSRKKKSCVAI